MVPDGPAVSMMARLPPSGTVNRLSTAGSLSKVIRNPFRSILTSPVMSGTGPLAANPSWGFDMSGLCTIRMFT